MQFTNNTNSIQQGGGGLVHQLRKSYSLTDLGHDENDYGATITEHRAITSDPGKVDTGKSFSDPFFIGGHSITT